MSIYPDWIEIDIGTGVTTMIDLLEVELVDSIIGVEMEAAVVVAIIDEAIEVEVI